MPRPIDDPLALAAATAADRAGRAAIARLLPDFSMREPGTLDAHAAPAIGRPLAAGAFGLEHAPADAAA